jgi:phage/plasmid-like protein (TIGR03299 family)
MKQDTYIVNTQQNVWSNKITDSINSVEDIGLNWDVQKTPMVALLEGKYPLPINSHVSINRSDSNESIGVVGSGYEPIQNTRIWEALHQSLEDTKHEVVGGGYTHNGGRVFVQTKVSDEDFTVDGDAFDNYVTFYSSHDGSSAFEMFDTSVRMICQNTFRLAKQQGGKAFKLKVRHTRNAEVRFENVMQHLESMFANRRVAYEKLNQTAETPMTYNDMIAWATSFFNKSNKLSTVSSNKAHEARRLALGGIGNQGRTAYDMFNGVTELLTHGDRQTSKDRSAIWRSSELGAGAVQKADALDHLSTLNARLDHIRRGRELINTGETLLSA